MLLCTLPYPNPTHARIHTQVRACFADPVKYISLHAVNCPIIIINAIHAHRAMQLISMCLRSRSVSIGKRGMSDHILDTSSHRTSARYNKSFVVHRSMI